MRSPSSDMNFVNILGKIVEIAHSNLEIASRINAILNILSSELHFDEVIVYTNDKDKRLSCRYMNRGSQLFHLLNNYRCHIGEGVIGTVAQKRDARFYNLHTIPPRLGCLFYSGLDDVVGRYKSFVFLPLADDSFLYGVLFVCSTSSEIISDTDKQALSIFSRELGGILRADDLLLSSKQRITELTTLSDLGRILTSTMEPHAILDNISLIVAKALNAIFATIRLELGFLKFDGQRFTCGQIDPSIESYVLELESEALRTQRPSTRSDLESTSSDALRGTTLFCAPIISKERTLGTITLCRKKETQVITDEQEFRYLLTTIASYISSGLENALLNIKLRDTLRELGDAQKRLIEHEKLSSLGEMTANIAHEIKNPLVIIGGFTKRLGKKAHLDNDEARYVEIITKEVDRLEVLLTEISEYVKGSSLLVEHCDLNVLLDETLYLIASDKVWGNIRIIRHYERALPPLLCDVQQIKQVLLNILNNAFEAMNGKGTLSVITEKTLFRNLPCLAVSVKDTGGGIDPSSLENIFNPFFTTKDKGSGLGLAIANKITRLHGGDIEVNNKPGEGVTFTVYLPSNTGTEG
jgi:signal transduction histidine kinase